MDGDQYYFNFDIIYVDFDIRQISDKYLGKPDFIQIFSANKVKYYHHKKQKRQEKC